MLREYGGNGMADGELFSMSELSHHRVLFVIPSTRFKDQEYVLPRRILERRKVQIEVAGPRMKDSYGTEGMRAMPNLTMEQVDVDRYSMIFFVGGLGSKEFLEDQNAVNLACAAVARGKFVAASSHAALLLAKAGVLKGRKATVYFSEAQALRDAGAEYTAAPLTIDDPIITAKGPESAEQLGVTMIQLLLLLDQEAGR